MAYLNSRPRTPETCPVCGEDVPPRALACPECGADHNSGWRENADTTGGLDLPDEDFDYDEFVKDEFAGGSQRGIKPLWWIVAVVLLATLIASMCFTLF
ncbi:MAG: zinc ribbon domain-containing protein [Terrimicrobiaceae bacterium]